MLTLFYLQVAQSVGSAKCAWAGSPTFWMSALKIKTKCQNVEIETEKYRENNMFQKNYRYIISGARCGWIRWLRARWWFFLRNYQPFELPRFFASKWYRTFSDLKKDIKISWNHGDRILPWICSSIHAKKRVIFP